MAYHVIVASDHGISRCIILYHAGVSKKIRVYEYRSVVGGADDVEMHMPMITMACRTKIRSAVTGKEGLPFEVEHIKRCLEPRGLCHCLLHVPAAACPGTPTFATT